MPYFPKSKINIKETSGDEFIYVSSRKPYKGSYIELSNGLYYAGKNPRNLGEKIIKPQITPTSFGTSLDFKKHKIIRSNTYKFLSKTKPIQPLKNIPVERDYERGYYKRYFAKRINQESNYMEIDEDTYNSISKKKIEYDFNLYIIGSIKWDLINSPNTNKLNLQLLEKDYPNISLSFPIFSEFQRITQINLKTEGKEYYFKDGTEYIGEYHIHPTKGAMVGANHIKEPHANLFKFNELSLNTRVKIKPESDIFAKFRDDYNSGEEAERIDEGRGGGSTGRPSGGSSTPSSGGGGVSSGGGGGY